MKIELASGPKYWGLTAVDPKPNFFRRLGPLWIDCAKIIEQFAQKCRKANFYKSAEHGLYSLMAF